ncbi:MAG TPA: metalloregulator ArsR/SmtB family transcription factor [Longimicrobiaceae bacterium]|nr:metalloregulator ArsR/SmtB family transcription factor [Longimicrobiaceae bacterium]
MNTLAPSSLFERMAALADPVRSRVLLVLEGHELTVSELCAVFQLPQSTMSRQLKVLSDEGWLVSRAEGTSRRYRMRAERQGAAGARLWQLVREQVAALPAADQDAQRVRSVLAERRSKSQEFFSTVAGEWDRLRGELFGGRAELRALLGLLDPTWVVGDLGSGTGQVAESLAPFVGRVVAVDESPEMLAAARRRLGGAGNVEIRRGELEALPIADEELDAAVLFLVLPYLPEPSAALAEVARVLRPGGTLLVADMTPHDREEYRQQMGHVWQGFSAEQLEGWTAAAGLGEFRYVPLPADPEAKGPALFAASAKRSSAVGPGLRGRRPKTEDRRPKTDDHSTGGCP